MSCPRGIFLLLTLAGLASAQVNPPTLTSINPNSAELGAPAFTMTLNGSNFATSAVAIWNNSTPLTTTFVSSAQLIASVPTSLLNIQGSPVVQVQNPDGSRSNALPFTITQTAVSITSDSLTSGVIGNTYSFSLVAAGGSPPYTWSLVSGFLPSGLTLNSNGILSGVPVTADTFIFTVRVTDRLQVSAQKSLQLTIHPPSLIITTSALPFATLGAPYTAPLAVSGGVSPYRWVLLGAPAGLTLDAATGVLSGTLNIRGNFAFTAQVTDATGATVSKNLNLIVNPAPLVISTEAVFGATVGLAYSQTFSALGGSPPFTWTLNGALGGGLSFDPAAATISGTPQTAGSFPFTVQVTDSAGIRTSKSFTLAVEPPRLSILTGSPLPSGIVGAPYSQRFSAVGGSAPYTWSLTGTSVPGLALDSAAGTLAGSPLSPGTFNFTIVARDSANLTTSKSFTILINPRSLTITTPRDLTAGVVGSSWNEQIEADGGVPPYTWSANGLPDGLTLDPLTGVLSGVPTAPGTSSFTIRVTDSLRATALDLFRIVVNVPTLPNFTLTGFPATVAPAQQPQIQLALSTAFPADLSGQLTLTFVPESGAGDSTIQFSTGGRTVPFTISSGSTLASFSVPSLALQTGTVAGSIRISAQLKSADIDVTPDPAPLFTTRIERATPTISRISFTRSSSGVSVQVTGFSTSREITQAVFRFSAAAGTTLQTPEITLPVENLFNTWFQDASSTRFGSQFTFSQQFTIQGNSSILNLESVTLTNRVGSTTARP